MHQVVEMCTAMVVFGSHKRGVVVGSHQTFPADDEGGPGAGSESEKGVALWGNACCSGLVGGHVRWPLAAVDEQYKCKKCTS